MKLEKSNNSLSVANKSLKKVLRDTLKKKDEEIETMACKLKELVEFKAAKDYEAREAQKQQQKLAKKRKKEAGKMLLLNLKGSAKLNKKN